MDEIEVIFREGSCCLCGDNDVNQYHKTDNFLNYDGNFISLADAIFECLQIRIGSEPSEICAECRDKLSRFLYFKKKAEKTQKNTKQQISDLDEPKASIVQTIMSIVTYYAKECSISSVKVDSSRKSLIITPNEKEDELQEPPSPESSIDESIFFEDPLSTKKQDPVYKVDSRTRSNKKQTAPLCAKTRRRLELKKPENRKEYLKFLARENERKRAYRLRKKLETEAAKIKTESL